jgi:hypothetical protein
MMMMMMIAVSKSQEHWAAHYIWPSKTQLMNVPRPTMVMMMSGSTFWTWTWNFANEVHFCNTLMSPGGILLGSQPSKRCCVFKCPPLQQDMQPEASGFQGKSLQVHPKVMRIYCLSGCRLASP